MSEDGNEYVGVPYTPGSDTSKAAAARTVTNVAVRRERVRQVLIAAGDAGLTHQELVLALPGESDSGVRTRCNELVKAGQVEDSGQRRRTRRGNAAVVWRMKQAAQ